MDGEIRRRPQSTTLNRNPRPQPPSVQNTNKGFETVQLSVPLTPRHISVPLLRSLSFLSNPRRMSAGTLCACLYIPGRDHLHIAIHS